MVAASGCCRGYVSTIVFSALFLVFTLSAPANLISDSLCTHTHTLLQTLAMKQSEMMVDMLCFLLKMAIRTVEF